MTLMLKDIFSYHGAVYLQTSFMGYGRDHEEWVSIIANNRNVATATSDSNANTWDQTSTRAIVHLNAGETVYLKSGNQPQDAVYHGGVYTIFTGALIKAD